MQKETNNQQSDPRWPIDGLEITGKCPACGATDRTILYEGLKDRIFFCAPGEWTLYRCESCACAYLDPRPTEETIGVAYQNYFTHDAVPSYPSMNFLEKVRYQLANGYRNYRYGTCDQPASIFGVLAAGVLPSGRRIVDAGMRHLPRRKGKRRLLDVGCGNGIFLSRAKRAGWDVMGIDIDPKIVAAASKLGLDVRSGGIESLESSVQFEVITLSHVIEHVHDPLKVLRICHEHLMPDGFLWIETPNITSTGHRLFGASWRGLEPPRHLVIFNPKSMRAILKTAGFINVEIQPYRPVCDSLFKSSMAISQGMDPYAVSGKTIPSRIVKKAERIARKAPSHRELITVKAWKKC